MILTIKVRDINSGLDKVVVEERISETESGNITAKKDEYECNGKRNTKTIEIKLSVPYNQYLRGYKITVTDKDGNKNEKEEEKTVQNLRYIIRTAQELQKFATEVNGGKTYKGKTIELENDIELNRVTGNWTPIGKDYLTAFEGTFNGNEHTISNMIISRSENNTGLFGYVGEYGKIENVKIKDCNITGSGRCVGGLVGTNYGAISNVSVSVKKITNYYKTTNGNEGVLLGGLVGINYKGTIENCFTEGEIYATDDYVGGLVGENASNGTIKNSYSNINITAKGKRIGGLIGFNTTDNGTIENCYSTGNITSEGNCVGGLVGYNEGKGTIKNSYSTGNVTGNDYIGGLVGDNEGKETIESCYATGNITGHENIGGLVGANYYEKIINCYSTGNVTGNVTGNERIGGLVGYVYKGIITNCYSIGKVTGNVDVGGLVGSKAKEATITSSYWDTQKSEMTEKTEGYGTGKTTEEMTKHIETYQDWNFETVWEWVQGDYPKLRPNSN